MSSTPNKRQIDAEIVELRRIKPLIRRMCSLEAENHHDAIDAQILVLKNQMDQDEVDEEFGDRESDKYRENIVSAAKDALSWLEGDMDEAPSVAWLDEQHLFK